ncbi:uncharacterized protein LOC120091799 isoform X2 [Benincasa hispida]|uniref:uncharacterized protein LOC120091799 isoform X2 n=1 Tax=Benincasa hispida TaxID=102211 RepID=UPI00190222BB|nr:uncharacterized protein LOC120091799 isoform X2 [Benincasa hispida]
MCHNLVAVSFQLPQLIINSNKRSKCYVHHKKKDYSDFVCFAVKNNNSNHHHQNPPIFSLKFSSFHPLSESPQASFDDYIEDEARLLRTTFSGKSEKINQMRWELKGLGTEFKPQRFTINVRGALYAERTESKSMLTNNFVLNLHNFAAPTPHDFFAQDFLQPFAEKGLKGMMEETMNEFTEILLLDYSKYKKEKQKNEVLANNG